jgi:hypothetical protein
VFYQVMHIEKVSLGNDRGVFIEGLKWVGSYNKQLTQLL